ARVELQLEARAFAQDIVLPIADELDGGYAAESYRSDGREGLVRHYHSSPARRYGDWCIRILPCLGGTRPRLAFGGQHLGTGTGTKGLMRIRGDLPPSRRGLN